MGTEVGKPLIQALKDFEKFPKDLFFFFLKSIII